MSDGRSRSIGSAAIAVVLLGVLVVHGWPDPDRGPDGGPPAAAAPRGEPMVTGHGAPGSDTAAGRVVVGDAAGTAIGRRYSLGGIVVDAHDRPVADVALDFASFADAKAGHCRSAADGRFEFSLDVVPTGHVEVADPRWVCLYEPILWTAADAAHEIVVVVAERLPLRGVVVDAATGATLEGAKLHVTAELPAPATFSRDLTRSRVSEWRTTSGAAGEFVLSGVAELPDLQVHGELRGYESAQQPIDDPRRPVRVELQASGSLLSGQVVDAGGEPAAGAAVFIGDAAAPVGDDGRFTIDLTHVSIDPAGQRHRLLIAARAGELPARLFGPEDTWDDASTWPHPLVLRLGERALTISGTVVGPDGSPVAGVQVRAVDLTPLADGEVVRTPRDSVEFLARVPAHVGADRTTFTEAGGGGPPGGFAVAGLQDRSYRLRVEDRAGLRAMVTAPVPAGTRGLTLELPADRTWDSLGGVVVDRRGAAVADCAITIRRVLADVAGKTHLELSLRTDADGRFRTTGPVSAAVTELLVQPPRTAQPQRMTLADHADPTELRVTVAVAVRVRVVASSASRQARAVAFRDANGRRVPIVITRGDWATGQTQVSLRDGASEVFDVLDSAVGAVLLGDHGEITRRGLQLDPSSTAPGGVRELRL